MQWLWVWPMHLALPLTLSWVDLYIYTCPYLFSRVIRYYNSNIELFSCVSSFGNSPSGDQGLLSERTPLECETNGWRLWEYKATLVLKAPWAQDLLPWRRLFMWNSSFLFLRTLGKPYIAPSTDFVDDRDQGSIHVYLLLPLVCWFVMISLVFPRDFPPFLCSSHSSSNPPPIYEDLAGTRWVSDMIL